MAKPDPKQVLTNFRDGLMKAAATVEEATSDAEILDETVQGIEVPADGDDNTKARENRRKELIALAAQRKANLAQRRADRIAADEDMAVTYARAKNLPYEPVLPQVAE